MNIKSNPSKKLVKMIIEHVETMYKKTFKSINRK